MNDLFDAAILFVDDEADILAMMQDLFKSEIGTIETCENPIKALEVFKKRHFDLVVLDLKMPGMDGMTLLQEMKKIRPEIGCVFLSGHGDKESVQKAMRLGADNFVDKPFVTDYMRLAIKRAVEKARYETLLKDVLEIFIYHYTKVDVAKFASMDFFEKEKTIRAALGVAKLQILKKRNKG